MTKTELLEIARNTKIDIVMENHSIYEIVFNLCDRYGAEVIEATAHNFIGFIPGQQRPDAGSAPEKAGL